MLGFRSMDSQRIIYDFRYLTSEMYQNVAVSVTFLLKQTTLLNVGKGLLCFRFISNRLLAS